MSKYLTSQKINDLSDSRMDVFARLSERELRGIYAPEEGLFIAESSKVITRALDVGYQPEALLLDETLSETEEAEKLVQRVPTVFTATLNVMEQIIGYKLTKGILCAMRRRPLPDPEEILQNAKRIAVLENVMNPTNLGAIFRSAAALSVDAIILSPSCTDPLYRRAARVSMGTVFQIPWTVAPKERDGAAFWPGPAIKMMQERQFITVAMALHGKTLSLEDPLLSGAEKLAVFLGAEGDGLTEETISLCDYTVTIPMAEGVDSLNVAAASAVVFWATGRHRGQLI